MRLIGEGNGNPLRYSCLENPMDRGAWWAAVCGVAQSQTWLKWLSMHACFGEGNGNSLQYSCLENPRDRGAWWAAICGAAVQSQTQLKWLSSSSSSAHLGELKGWQLVSCMIFYMFQCHSPKSSHPLPLPESIRLIYTSVSLLLSHTQGYCYHLSKFHIYVLVYCIGVFLSGLLHSV